MSTLVTTIVLETPEGIKDGADDLHKLVSTLLHESKKLCTRQSYEREVLEL